MKDFAKFVFTSWAFMLICKLKLRKSLMKIFKVFFESVLKLKLRLQRKFKIRDFYLLGSYPLVDRHVVKHG